MKSDARQTLSDFLVREIGEGSERAWARKHGLRPDDVRKTRHGQNGITIDRLQRFADALGVEPWQLLFPGFERGSPQFPTMSTEAIDVARELDRIPDEATRRRAYATIMQQLEMVSEALAAKAQPTAPPTLAGAPSAPHRTGS